MINTSQHGSGLQDMIQPPSYSCYSPVKDIPFSMPPFSSPQSSLAMMNVEMPNENIIEEVNGDMEYQYRVKTNMLCDMVASLRREISGVTSMANEYSRSYWKLSNELTQWKQHCRQLNECNEQLKSELEQHIQRNQRQQHPSMQQQQVEVEVEQPVIQLIEEHQQQPIEEPISNTFKRRQQEIEEREREREDDHPHKVLKKKSMISVCRPRSFREEVMAGKIVQQPAETTSSLPRDVSTVYELRSKPKTVLQQPSSSERVISDGDYEIEELESDGSTTQDEERLFSDDGESEERTTKMMGGDDHIVSVDNPCVTRLERKKKGGQELVLLSIPMFLSTNVRKKEQIMNIVKRALFPPPIVSRYRTIEDPSEKAKHPPRTLFSLFTTQTNNQRDRRAIVCIDKNKFKIQDDEVVMGETRYGTVGKTRIVRIQNMDVEDGIIVEAVFTIAVTDRRRHYHNMDTKPDVLVVVEHENYKMFSFQFRCNSRLPIFVRSVRVEDAALLASSILKDVRLSRQGRRLFTFEDSLAYQSYSMEYFARRDRRTTKFTLSGQNSFDMTAACLYSEFTIQSLWKSQEMMIKESTSDASLSKYPCYSVSSTHKNKNQNLISLKFVFRTGGSTADDILVEKTPSEKEVKFNYYPPSDRDSHIDFVYFRNDDEV